MKSALIRLGNWGHRQDSPWVRRGAVAIAVAGLMLWTLLAAIFFVALGLLFPLLAAIKHFCTACYAMPSEWYDLARDEARSWRINWAGARRAWRAQKVPAHKEQADG